MGWFEFGGRSGVRAAQALVLTSLPLFAASEGAAPGSEPVLPNCQANIIPDIAAVHSEQRSRALAAAPKLDAALELFTDAGAASFGSDLRTSLIAETSTAYLGFKNIPSLNRATELFFARLFKNSTFFNAKNDGASGGMVHDTNQDAHGVRFAALMSDLRRTTQLMNSPELVESHYLPQEEFNMMNLFVRSLVGNVTVAGWREEFNPAFSVLLSETPTSYGAALAHLNDPLVTSRYKTLARAFPSRLLSGINVSPSVILQRGGRALVNSLFGAYPRVVLSTEPPVMPSNTGSELVAQFDLSIADLDVVRELKSQVEISPKVERQIQDLLVRYVSNLERRRAVDIAATRAIYDENQRLKEPYKSSRASYLPNPRYIGEASVPVAMLLATEFLRAMVVIEFLAEQPESGKRGQRLLEVGLGDLASLEELVCTQVDNAALLDRLERHGIVWEPERKTPSLEHNWTMETLTSAAVERTAFRDALKPVQP